MNSGYCAPTILMIIIFIIGVIFHLITFATSIANQNDGQIILQSFSLILFIVVALLVIYGFFTLCAAGQSGWAWGIIGIKILAGILTALQMSSYSCDISRTYTTICKGLHQTSQSSPTTSNNQQVQQCDGPVNGHIHGHTISGHVVQNNNQCEDLCLENPNCKAYVYDNLFGYPNPNANCGLKTEYNVSGPYGKLGSNVYRCRD